jgi:succinate dehydrogenase/fumarate reductase flavoprotein subunit
MSISSDLLWKNAPKWPYPVNYGRENEVSADVLIIGGGIAGCHAAISAAQKGVRVAVVDKAAVIRSGSGGAGVDHWGSAYTNPCSKITPEEAMKSSVPTPFEGGGYRLGHVRFIASKESWDALLDMEKWGMKIRDVDDEFVGAPFRDEKTKLLFAYDYDNPDTIRVQGAKVKVFLYNEVKRQGVKIFDHVMVTSLLKEGGDSGRRVIGATGFNVRTGEFYIFKAKATILSTAQPLRLWIFNTELAGSNTEHDDPNLCGDGDAMGWLAGAELTLMERSEESAGPFRYPAYGTGNAHNTWFACNIVDARGKPVPWVDGTGKILKTVEERYHAGGEGPGGATLIPDLAERIMKGEYVLPFYADLPSMPEHERRAIFGLMVAHEGKTHVPIYFNYTRAGFDPDKDMLQANVLPPQLAGRFTPWWDPKSSLFSAPQWRATAFAGGGGLLVDWDLRTNLEGLYAAGAQTASGGGHPGSAATGRYAGRKAADYSKAAKEPIIDRKQVEAEKSRVYAPVGRKGDIGWKELQAGICRIMQDYCGEYKSDEILKTGLWWLNSIRESEAERTYVRNPHELWRLHECNVRLTIGEIIMHASLARKASSRFLGLKRIDFPEMDPPEWKKLVTIRLEDGQVKAGELPFDYWLQPPYAPTYEENYKLHSGL